MNKQMKKIITPDIIYLPPEIRARLTRLCPYVGSHIPHLARENAKSLDPVPSGWQWDEDGWGNLQWELELCDLDNDRTVDPAGYVAIRPLEHGKYALIFVIGLGVIGLKWPDPVFDSMQEAKRFLDALLAISTPQIPV